MNKIYTDKGGKLEGNASRKLLTCLDSLEIELQKVSDEVVILGLPFIHALRDFGNIVHMCFGSILLNGWKQSIDKFTSSYSALVSPSGNSISVTPKVN